MDWLGRYCHAKEASVAFCHPILTSLQDFELGLGFPAWEVSCVSKLEVFSL